MLFTLLILLSIVQECDATMIPRKTKACNQKKVIVRSGWYSFRASSPKFVLTTIAIMRKIPALLIAAMLTGFYSTAQMTQNGQSSAKVVYGEIGGPGLLSINYDMRLSNKNDGFGFRAGFGGWSLKDSKLIFVPLGLNYITSKNNRDYFEAGAGGTIVSNSNKGSGEGPFKSSFGFLTLGYRKQPVDGGYFFKASLVPVFGKGFFWPYYAGVGFGYAF
ncbi:MAG: hypothetical protein JWQ09_5139 [Segetibacter sp.]|nr:hypothetical protein [Segetibacter sp.]